MIESEILNKAMRIVKEQADQVNLTDSDTTKLYLIYNMYKLDERYRIFIKCATSAYSESVIKEIEDEFCLDFVDLCFKLGLSKVSSGR